MTIEHLRFWAASGLGLGLRLGSGGLGWGQKLCLCMIFIFHSAMIKFKGIYFELWNLLELFKQI